MSLAGFFRWLFGRKKKKKVEQTAVEQPLPAASVRTEQDAMPSPRPEALPAPVKAAELPAPEKAEALPEPEKIEALPAPEKPAELPAPVKAEALPAPEKAEAEPVKQAEVTPSEPVTVTLTAPKSGLFFRPVHNFSYTARLIQSDDIVKGYYSEIKNEIMRYGVKERISWRYETFRKGRKLLIKLVMRGKSLYVYLALDPAAYADTKYKIKDVSNIKSKADVPVLYKIKNARRVKYVKQLIADLMAAANGIAAGELPTVDYAAQYPYETVEQLIEEKLVKIIVWKEVEKPEQQLPDYEEEEEEFEEDDDDDEEEEEEPVAEEVAAAEPEIEEEPEIEVPEVEPEPVIEEVVEKPVKAVAPEEVKESVTVVEAEEVIADEEVEHYIEEAAHYSDKTKKAIVNVDTLSRYFKKGETATLAEMIKRIPAIGKKVTYIKVLARGALDKPLTVEADDFSPAAIKMIVLTGGKVIRTKQRT